MFYLEYEEETIYYLENPETDQVTFATGSQLRYEDIVKNVFGVASIHDLPMMIQYNKSFQSSISESHGVMENEVKLEMVLRVASKMDLLQLKKQYLDNQKNDQSASLEETTCVPVLLIL